MLPDWLPASAHAYIVHTSANRPIRAIARDLGCHASTVLRQVRKVEASRDDPLVDEALERIGRAYAAHLSHPTKEDSPMAKPAVASCDRPDPRIEREARRILRRLCEKGAFLAVSPEMERAVVLREVVPGRQNRIAVVERDVAYAFALQEWIACEKAGRIACYAITPVGRAALKRLLTEERQAKAPKTGFAEVQSPFQEQHRFFAERTVMADDGSGERKLRFNLAESPLSVLGRKRDKTGEPYLAAELIEAGERLREDFELAQLGPRVAQNWERFLTAGASRGEITAGRGPGEGPANARLRVAKAMEALGPGLSDIVFRICCFLEGVETAEKRLGWSARSGKVVLKIALERLSQHYDLRRSAQRSAG
jgi:DNA-binding Lrp family transcriptional regulator